MTSYIEETTGNSPPNNSLVSSLANSSAEISGFIGELGAQTASLKTVSPIPKSFGLYNIHSAVSNDGMMMIGDGDSSERTEVITKMIDYSGFNEEVRTSI